MAEPAGLAQEQRRALDRLSRRPELSAFYLAGGSAIALHLGHRRSLDLDLFSVQPDADLDSAERAVSYSFAAHEVVSRSDAAVQLICDGERIDLVRYPYALLDPPSRIESGFAVASLRDLGVMKLAAIARRGIRRDFWDLHAILDAGDHTLVGLGQDYVRKFGVREADLYHVLKALTYFEDAERDPAFPAGLSSDRWQSIKELFRAEAPKLVGGGT
jgi:hypothetical protein